MRKRSEPEINVKFVFSFLSILRIFFKYKKRIEWYDT
jgi:hypothetical protein